jgi:thiamine biosynthesis lipoprotein
MKSLNKKHKRVRALLGTFVAIELQGPVSTRQLDEWINQGFEAFAEVDRFMSIYRPESDIARLNARPGEWIKIHPLTRRVLTTANNLFLKSRGAFDIRCLPPAVFAASDSKRRQLPVEIRGERVRKTGSWQIDLGGIAKGFAVDLATERIQRSARGWVLSGSVNAGGDLRIWGRERQNVAVQVSGKWLSRLQITDTAVATSSVRDGNARLSPAAHRRMPSATLETRPWTATVFAPRCIWADALTKIVLTAPETAARCISSYNARAVVYPTPTSRGIAIG